VLASIAQVGQQLPIVVVRDAQVPVVVDGYKRVRALRRLRHDTVVAIAWELSEADALVLERLLRAGSADSAIEQGWLLREMGARFGLRSRGAGATLRSHAELGESPPRAGRRAPGDLRLPRVHPLLGPNSPGSVGAGVQDAQGATATGHHGRLRLVPKPSASAGQAATRRARATHQRALQLLRREWQQPQSGCVAVLRPKGLAQVAEPAEPACVLDLRRFLDLLRDFPLPRPSIRVQIWATP
jgi:hypothetical protein